MSWNMRVGLLWHDLDASAAAMRESFGDHTVQLLEAADAICRHEFDLLGSGPVCLDDFRPTSGTIPSPGKLPWHCDFKSGYAFDHTINHAEHRPEKPPGVCGKMPWDFSRFYHGPLLGMAWRITGDRKYADELAWQWQDWLEAVPYPLGAPWGCTMDVGIRAAVWLTCLQLLDGSDALTPALQERMFLSLCEHGRMCFEHLEKWPWIVDGEEIVYTTNHYLSDIFGLFFLGHCLPEGSEAEKWRAFARHEMESEMNRQVYPDGMANEASTGYQRLDMEMLFFAARLAENFDEPMGRSYLQRLREMFRFQTALLADGGRFIAIGDHDSGMTIKLGHRPLRDHGYLLSYGWAMFGFDALRRTDVPVVPELVWLYGPEMTARIQQAAASRAPTLAIFASAGITVFRAGADMIVIPTCPNGQMGVGGHAHNDKLGVVLVLGGREIIADPGTYFYDDLDTRSESRQTATHATLMVDGQEQCEFTDESRWEMADITRARIQFVTQQNDKYTFAGTHSGYARLSNPVEHERRVEATSDVDQLRSIAIKDRLRPLDHSPADHDLLWSFPLGPGLSLKLEDSMATVVDERGKPMILIRWSLPVQATDEDGWYAEEYGRKEPARVLRLRARHSLDEPMRFTIDRPDCKM
jgi:hypothetical protein